MIAHVTGSSRGVGKGVALALADAYGFTDEDGSQPRSLRAQFEEVR